MYNYKQSKYAHITYGTYKSTWDKSRNFFSTNATSKFGLAPAADREFAPLTIFLVSFSASLMLSPYLGGHSSHQPLGLQQSYGFIPPVQAMPTKQQQPYPYLCGFKGFAMPQAYSKQGFPL